MIRRRPLAAAIVGLVLAAAGPADTHPLAPSLLEVQVVDGGVARVTWKTPLARSRGSRLAPLLPPECEPEGPVLLRVEGTGRVETSEIRCPFDDWTGHRVGVVGLTGVGTSVLLRFAARDRPPLEILLTPGRPELVLPERMTRLDVALRYGRLGVEHLVLGFDHVLFLMGLLLLARGRGSWIRTMTAFTVGHSLTLALAILGFVEIPPAPVEVVIAASILAPAVEIARGRGAGDSGAGHAPWLFALVFGLLHGLGFAGALSALGLPPDSIPLALVSFNLGIELGQLAWAAGLGVVLWTVRAAGVRDLPDPVRRAFGYGLGVAAGAWFWIRLWAWLIDPIA